VLVMHARRIARGDRENGVTAVELLIVLVIVAVLAVVAAPSLASVVVAQRLRAAGTDLVSALLLARSEAIKRNVNVTVRPAVGDDWGRGWITATAGGEQIDRRNGPGTRVQVTLAPAAIVYAPTGRLDGGGATRVEFVDAEGQPGVAPRCVSVDLAGLPRLAAQGCS
jgi:type IV fimbrial biogenesis protein FimT